jgi:hypothetical protein
VAEDFVGLAAALAVLQRAAQPDAGLAGDARAAALDDGGRIADGSAATPPSPAS